MPTTLRGQRLKPQPWPVSPLNIDPQYRALWRGLVFAVVPGGNWQTELTTRTLGNVVGSGTFDNATTIGSSGLAAGAADGLQFESNSRLRGITKNYTLVWLGEAHVRGGGSSWIHLLSLPYRTTGWTAPYFAVRMATRYTATGIQLHHQQSGTYIPANTLATSDSGFLDFDGDGQVHRGAATRDGATVRFYKDGMPFGANATLTNNTDPDFSAGPAGGTNVGIGTRSPYSAGEGGRSTHAVALVYDRTLDDAEIALIWKDPYGFIRPRRIVSAAAPAANIRRYRRTLVGVG